MTRYANRTASPKAKTAGSKKLWEDGRLGELEGDIERNAVKMKRGRKGLETRRGLFEAGQSKMLTQRVCGGQFFRHPRFPQTALRVQDKKQGHMSLRHGPFRLFFEHGLLNPGLDHREIIVENPAGLGVRKELGTVFLNDGRRPPGRLFLGGGNKRNFDGGLKIRRLRWNRPGNADGREGRRVKRR